MLRRELATSNLQLIREFTFNTEQNVTQAVESLQVSIISCDSNNQFFHLFIFDRILQLELFS